MRLTQMNGIDLGRFDFDYDNTWQAFFLDAHLNVYSRYGGRDASSPESRLSLKSLSQTMEAVLRDHARRPAAAQDPAVQPQPAPVPAPKPAPGRKSGEGAGGPPVLCDSLSSRRQSLGPGIRARPTPTTSRLPSSKPSRVRGQPGRIHRLIGRPLTPQEPGVCPGTRSSLRARLPTGPSAPPRESAGSNCRCWRTGTR
ncbi:MAG: hypothetical protein ACKOFW_12875, partial [Planctomycetaceae bacterium]